MYAPASPGPGWAADIIRVWIWMKERRDKSPTIVLAASTVRLLPPSPDIPSTRHLGLTLTAERHRHTFSQIQGHRKVLLLSSFYAYFKEWPKSLYEIYIFYFRLFSVSSFTYIHHRTGWPCNWFLLTYILSTPFYTLWMDTLREDDHITLARWVGSRCVAGVGEWQSSSGFPLHVPGQLHSLL